MIDIDPAETREWLDAIDITGSSEAAITTCSSRLRYSSICWTSTA